MLGWIALESAIAGGADIALIPEIPYDIQSAVKKVEERRKMEKSTNFEMFVEAKHYIDKHHADNPIDFVINGYIFYYMSGRFPNALMHDVCDVVEALRTHYIHEFCVIDKDLSDDDEELPFK